MYTKVDKKDPLFITKLTTPEALKYWIRLMVEGYKRLYKNGDFSKCDIVEDFNLKYHRDNNPALDYVEEMGIEDFEDKPIRDVYDEFEKWCEDNAVTFSQKMISDILLSEFGLDKRTRRVNGKPTKCFMSNQEV